MLSLFILKLIQLLSSIILSVVVHICYVCHRCQIGFQMTHDGKNCTDLDECYPINPCQNGGYCTNFPGGRGFQCACPPGFYGKYCNALQVGKELQFSSAALIMIIICIVNLMS